jgi:hypothetical protein
VENEDGRPDQLTLTPADHAFIMTRNRANRLGFAVLLAFFRSRGRFPRAESEIERSGMEELAGLLNIALSQRNGLVLSERTAERHRAEIRAYPGFHEATVADAEMLTAWLSDRAASMGGVPEHLAVLLDERCCRWRRKMGPFWRVKRDQRWGYAVDRFGCCVGCLTLLSCPAATLVALLQPAPIRFAWGRRTCCHHLRGARRSQAQTEFVR